MTSLSQSDLWLHMKDYYEQLGLEVWEEEVVPLDITSNVYLANLYARLILSAINDYRDTLNSDQPFTIVELGVGHGKFSFYLLKMLIQGLDTYRLDKNSIRYVMTDISMKNIESWRANKAFAPYIEQGILDFAFYNALDDNELVLLNSKETIGKKSLDKPIFVIANYLFDSLPADAFQIRDGKLFEAQLNLKGQVGPGSAVNIKDYFEKADFDFSYNQIDCNYYSQYPQLNKVLEQYKETFEEASFTIPIGGIQCLEKIQAFTKSALVVFVSDKAVANPSFFDGLEVPDISIHGSFSMTVNFDALSRYTESCDGLSLTMDNQNADFQVGCFCYQTDRAMPYTEYAFKSSLSAFSPVDLYNLCYSHQLDTPNEAFKSLDELLALLNLAQWDPNIFYDYQEILIGFLEDNEITHEQEAGILNGIEKVWDYFFLLEKSKDMPFCIGCILYELERWEPALCYFEQSVNLFSQGGETYLNMAFCYQNMDQPAKAIAMANKALEMDSDMTAAKELINELAAN